jgi:hypothetical protein
MQQDHCGPVPRERDMKANPVHHDAMDLEPGHRLDLLDDVAGSFGADGEPPSCS